MKQSDINCQRYLQVLYQQPQNQSARQKYHVPVYETNGELLYPSVHKLLAITPLTPSDIFVDLGSGTGKIVLQVFLTTAAQEARGIEIVPQLHSLSVNVEQQVRQDLPALFTEDHRLRFISGDFFQTPLAGATVVLVNATCFGQDILYPLSKILDNTPTIHTVWSTRPLCQLQRLRTEKIIPIECSWSSSLLYLSRAASAPRS